MGQSRELTNLPLALFVQFCSLFHRYIIYYTCKNSCVAHRGSQPVVQRGRRRRSRFMTRASAEESGPRKNGASKAILVTTALASHSAYGYPPILVRWR